MSSVIAKASLEVCVESGDFSTLDEHMFDSTGMNNHIFTLIKCCCQSYVTIGMHHLGKLTNAKRHDMDREILELSTQNEELRKYIEKLP